MTPKGPRNRFTVVPWMNSEQLNKVYNCLYSDSLSSKRWAVDQISVWNTRCYPSLPSAVESTVNLVRATVHDMLYQADKTFCQEEDIQMLYCMALIRFVNLSVEHHQNAANKISLSVLAKKLNIPTWVLDLRNEASHSFCPSLSMLRMGAEFALQHLKETFWSKEVSNVKPIKNLPSEWESEVVNLINQYKSVQFERASIKDLKQISGKDKKDRKELKWKLGKDLKDILHKIAPFILRYRENFLDVLVQPGNFIAAEDIEKLISRSAPFAAQDANYSLPLKMQSFWAPLLRKIHAKDLMQMFLEKLLIAQKKCRIKICHKTAIAWTLLILLGVSSTSVLSDCFRRKGLLLNVPALMYACTRGTTHYSAELLTALVARFKEKERFTSFFYLMSIYQGRYLTKEDLSSKRKRDIDEEIIFTVEDVEEELNEMKAKKMRSEKVENVWSSPSVTMDFSNLPIGAILTPVSLDASQDKQSSEDPWKDQIKIDPSADDNFIIVNKNDGGGTVEEEITHDINTFPVTTRPENFDMVYRRRPKQ